jgi:copper chaperone CopZ
MEDPMDETSRTYRVTGMTCQHCAAAVTEEVSAVPGVTSVEVDVPAGTVVVHGADVSDEGVRAAVDEAGYAVA